MRLPRIVVALGVTSALALASCGGGSSGSASGVPASQWTANLCKTALDYTKNIKSAETQETSALQNVSSVSQAKSQVVGLLQSGVDQTQSAIDRVQTVGPPAVDNGAKIQAQVDRAFHQAKVVLQQALDQMQSAPTSDPAAFSTTASSIGAAVTTGFTQVQNAFGAIDQLDTSGALTKAGAQNPTCQALTHQ